MPDRLQHALDRALERIDAYNRDDPQGKELLYSQQMTARLLCFEPQASEALQLAVRAQHIGRWRIPRSEYPMDRPGYKQWRTRLAEFHAETTAAILCDCGYDEETVSRVESLLKKKNLKTDPQCQTLEDVACLVFLEHYLASFAEQHDDPKLIRVLQRTWLKMSERGHAAALELELPPKLQALLKRALAEA